MIGAEPSFARCLAVALGVAPEQLPRPDGDDPGVFWRQWLAGRNLGLVPIDDPAGFAWPGHWIAVAEGADGSRDAVLMFGVPSGPLLDHSDLLPAGEILEAVLVAPFQLGLDPSLPYGEPTETGGLVAGLLIAPAAEAPLEPVEAVEAHAGRGLAGDRYAAGTGTFSGTGRGYELTLIEAEALEALAAEGVEVSWEEARRNVVTQGIGLNALVGRRFTVGEVECIGRRLAEPCSHLQRLAPAGTLGGLVHRAGLRADILGSGTIRVGDPVVPVREP